MKDYLLFDLDGTLTDPKEGICTCVQYALASFGIEEPDLDKLEPYIGPPLKDSFMNFHGLDEKQAEAAIEKYRERFKDKGIFENRLYDGIPQMLRILKSRGMHLAVASSKPTVFVERILEHFKIAKYFEVVVGSELDGGRSAKEEVVREALRKLFEGRSVEWDRVYMIGDRSFDVAGAHAARVESVGVTYGYGSMEELKEAKSDYIVRSVAELQRFLLRGAEGIRKMTMAQRIWQLGYPFLLFYLLRSFFVTLMQPIFVIVGTVVHGGEFLYVRDSEGVLEGMTDNAYTIIIAIGFLGAGAAIYGMAKRAVAAAAADMRIEHLKKEPWQNYLLLGLGTVGLSLGINLALDLSGAAEQSAAYQQVAQTQYSPWLAVGLICYGIITPITEELLFRGIIYNYVKRYLKLGSAIVISAALFAFYHGNSIQGIYAFAMGAFMAYAYEYFGSFKVAAGIHMAANILVYLLSYAPIAEAGFRGWPECILCLVWGVGSVYLLNKGKQIL